jgi:hypothetical protein
MKKIFFLIFFIFIYHNAQAENQRLSEAYENEIIEEVKSAFQPRGIEEKVERPICATSIFLEIKANWDRFSPKAKAILKSYTERPTFNFPEHTYDTPPGHFKIHYVTEGDSAVPNENWVHTCGEVLEHVWDTEIIVLGYREPPSDSWYPDSNGGDGKYDVYLLHLGPYNILGYTQRENFVSSYSLSATSFIVLDNDYLDWVEHSPVEYVQVTFAHEFFHAIQMSYDATECEYVNQRPKFYWMEMSAVWMEDMVYDNVNDYRGYLPSFFNHPEWSLKTFGVPLEDPLDVVLHPYGSCVWPIYLSEKFGRDIIKDIWDKCGEVPENNAIDYPLGKSATDKALEARGSNFEDAFREFTVWNYFTANRAIPQLFYSEGDSFYYLGTPVMVRVDAIHTTYPVNVTSIPHPPENLGSNYVVFVPDIALGEGGMKIDFIGHSGDYKVSVLGYRPYPLPPFETTIFLDPFSMTGTLDFYNWNVYNPIVMIPAVITRSPNYSWTYEYQADYDSSLHGESPLPQEDKILQNYPNPFVIATESDSTFFPFMLSSPSRVRVDIFTLGGERLKTLVPKNDPEYPVGEYLDRIYAVPWDGKNENGEYVSSGIYLYRFRTDRATVIKKMAVIR